MSQSTTIGQSLESQSKDRATDDNTVPASLVSNKAPKVRKRKVTEKQLAALRPAKKGEIRNPAGINGFTHARVEMRTKAESLMAKAMAVLEKNLESEDERVAQTAAQTLLDRAFGKAIQPTADVDTEGNDRPAPPPMVVIGVRA